MSTLILTPLDPDTIILVEPRADPDTIILVEPRADSDLHYKACRAESLMVIVFTINAAQYNQ